MPNEASEANSREFQHRPVGTVAVSAGATLEDGCIAAVGGRPWEAELGEGWILLKCFVDVGALRVWMRFYERWDVFRGGSSDALDHLMSLALVVSAVFLLLGKKMV